MAANDAAAAPSASAPAVEGEWPSSADAYELVASIGHGAFATVHKAVLKSGPRTGTEVAVKVIELEEFADSSLEEIRRELQMMRMCRHQNVINKFAAFPARRQMWLVMPLLAGGSCANVMRARKASGGFEDETIIAYILRETAKAIDYFHDNMQIHRDLKAGNVLLGEDGRVYLSDFGVAAPLRDDKLRQTFVGTPCWMAPEILEQVSGYDCKADIWSFGITAIELAYGEAPYQRLHPLKVMKIIIEKDPPRIDRRKWDANFAALVEACLQKDPKRRPAMEDIIKDHGRFFARAAVEPLVEILHSLPPLEKRIQAKPQRKASTGGARAAATGSWDFRTDDFDDDDAGDDFPGLGETEG
jgi:serine/threonine-protein kinase OSR1/STK39